MVNAKDEIVAKHVNADGTIDWVGVTGENNAVHDHWVDGFGNDVIRDFNRAQGDKIEIRRTPPRSSPSSTRTATAMAGTTTA